MRIERATHIYISGQGFAARVAGDGREGLRAVFERKPDLIALEVTMPNKDEWETLARMREVSDVPVIMLTVRGGEADVLHGFSLGADDYATKPFSFAQLAARIHAVLARGGKSNTAEGTLHGGDLEVDLCARRVTRGGEPIALTPTEFKLLTALMRRAGEGEVETLSADLIVNAAGPWAAKVATLAGVKVDIEPSVGAMVTVAARLCNRVINRLAPPGDGDIIVPKGQTSILGAISWTVTEIPPHLPANPNIPHFRYNGLLR